MIILIREMKPTIVNIMLLAGVTAMSGLSSCTTNEIDRPADETEKPAYEAPQQEDKGYFIFFNGEYGAEAAVGTRAHWEEDGQNVPLFYWDSSDDEMKAFVFRNTTSVDYITGNTYANVKVTPKEDRLKCSLQIADGLSEEYQDGDVIWAVSPIRYSQNIEGSTVTFALPAQYEYTDGQDSPTTHLKNYVLMSGTETVQNGSASINFQIHPTVFRFKITNSDTEDLTLNSISFSGPFNNQAVLSYDGSESVTFSKSTDDSQPYSIKVNISEGLTISPAESKYLYAIVMPTELSNESVTFSITSSFGDKSQTLAYDDVFPGKDDTPDTGFKSNTYKTLNVTMKRTSVQLSGTSINGFGQGGNFDVGF